MNQALQVVDTPTATARVTQPLVIDEPLLVPLRDLPCTAGAMGARQARSPRAFVAVALTLVAVAGLASSALTYRVGRAWRDRAQTEISRTDSLAFRLRAAETQLASAAGELAATTATLRRSEADVAQLESRLQELGMEKARVEDEREASRSDRDRLAMVAGLAAQVEQELSGCVSGLSGLLFPRSPGLAYAAAGRGGTEEAVARSCGNAKTMNERLRAVVNG
ncbi:MAG: hypothetical protein ACRD0K_25145 [Egibacteraceae bacterium]